MHARLLHDFDLEFVTDAVGLLDRQLEYLDRLVDTWDDPEGMGVFDRFEYVVGLGFAALQTYLTAIRSEAGLGKDAYDRPPHHHSGVAIAAAVNAAANHWKHSAEWSTPSDGAHTRQVLRALGADLDRPYALGNVLAALVKPMPARLAHVLPSVTQWRADVLSLP